MMHFIFPCGAKIAVLAAWLILQVCGWGNDHNWMMLGRPLSSYQPGSNPLSERLRPIP